MKRRGRAEQKQATRARLLAVARSLFAEHGYDATNVAMVCRRARVTHGALYHHFPGKLDLFAGVLEAVFVELADEITARVAPLSGWARLETACDAWLERCSDRVVLAVVVRDGPRVLPPERFDEIDRAVNAPMVIGLLQQAVDEGVLRPVPVEVLAPLLGAAFAGAGAAIASSPEPESTRRACRELLLAWLAALRP